MPISVSLFQTCVAELPVLLAASIYFCSSSCLIFIFGPNQWGLSVMRILRPSANNTFALIDDSTTTLYFMWSYDGSFPRCVLSRPSPPSTLQSTGISNYPQTTIFEAGLRVTFIHPGRPRDYRKCPGSGRHQVHPRIIDNIKRGIHLPHLKRYSQQQLLQCWSSTRWRRPLNHISD